MGILVTFTNCVVPENIHTTPTEGICYMTPPPLCSKFLKQILINAQISEFWRNWWKSSWPPANEMQGTWFKSCAGVAFPSIPEWAWFSPCQEAREKGKNPCNIDPKIPMKIWFHCPPTFLSSNPKILKAFLKPFPTKIKSTKWPAKEKKEARNWNY